MMSPEKKLKFVHQMTHLALKEIPHYDVGGMVGGLGGGISNFLGTQNSFQPGAAAITPGTNAKQLGTAYTGAQGALNNQAGLVKTTQPGVNQGVGTQNVLAKQLAAESLGQGPNPAQAALNQSTGQNINETAALMASQRGAGANAGMLAENAARQGAATQQQAVGQAATLQAQQQIAAQQQAQGLAAQQIGQGANAIQGQNQFAQGEQGVLQNANAAANNAAVTQQANINNVGANVSAGNQNAAGNAIGGLFSAASAAAPLVAALFADGGEVHKMAEGGYMAPTPLVVNPSGGPQSFVGQFVNGSSQMPGMMQAEQSPLGTPANTGYSEQAEQFGSTLAGLKRSPNTSNETAGGAADVNDIPNNSLPTEIGQQGPMMAARGGKAKKMLPPMGGKNAMLKAKGGPVKGAKEQQAVSDHDDYANDKVPAELTAGEVVMDLDTLHDPGPIGKMARAVAQHIQMRNAKGKKHV